MDTPTIDGIGMAQIEDVVNQWGLETILDMRKEFARKIGFGNRKFNKLSTDTYNDQDNWTPKSNSTLDFITWILTQPAYVDEGVPPGTSPTLSDLWKWADKRDLPYGITTGKGLSRQDFLIETRKLVFDRGVEGLNYSQIFEENSRVSDLEKRVYITIEDLIDRKLQRWEKNYR